MSREELLYIALGLQSSYMLKLQCIHACLGMDIDSADMPANKERLFKYLLST